MTSADVVDLPDPEPLPDDDEPEPVTLADMLATGATYRQLDYWTRQGWLQPDRAEPGSGHNRAWRPEDLTIAGFIVRLTRAGVAMSRAAMIANDAVAYRSYTFSTEHGVAITISRNYVPPPVA